MSAKQLAYVVCDACNMQVFARSDRSDSKLRDLHIPGALADAEPPPVRVEPAEPAAPAEPAKRPAAAQESAAVPQPTDKPKPQAMAWGAFPFLK